MGLISKILGIAPTVDALGRVVKETSEVFHVNETEREEMANERFERVVEIYGKELAAQNLSRFGRFVDAINRLPRPIMALGTVGMFAYAMLAPEAFSARMIGLALVPEPLWWLLGSVVGFYFGAREMYHFRKKDLGESLAIARAITQTKATERAGKKDAPVAPNTIEPPISKPSNAQSKAAKSEQSNNAAINDWLAIQNG